MNSTRPVRGLGELKEGCPAESTWLAFPKPREPADGGIWDYPLKCYTSPMTLTKPTFPEPNHDHDRCAADGIDHAERVCEQRSQKFTPIRRQVLQALLSSHRPLGAYEVIEELAKSMPRPAPITVYRALDFLMENGLVHRIESRNAYLACAHDHDAAAMVAFLICDACGSVGEIPAMPAAQSINTAARATGFAPKLSVVEITGTCVHCQK